MDVGNLKLHNFVALVFHIFCMLSHYMHVSCMSVAIGSWHETFMTRKFLVITRNKGHVKFNKGFTVTTYYKTNGRSHTANISNDNANSTASA